MGKKLTIVVTCTDRKSRRPSATLQARSLPVDDVRTRAALWTERLSTASDRVALCDLYQGEAWTQARRLTAAAREAGFGVKVLVASAGLGLQPVEERFPAYAATFSPRHPDTVGSDVSEKQEWWREVNRGVKGESLSTIRGPVLLVLSDAYSRVVQYELEELVHCNRDVTIVGGHRDFDANNIRSDRTLRSALGGTTISLNQRMAVKWLNLAPNASQLGSDAHQCSWGEWVAERQRPEVFDGQRMDDLAVFQWIREAQRRRPGLSRSAALTQLRAEGYACERKRFNALFDRVAMAA